MGYPDDWGNFQGVQNQDYASYPEGNVQQCDNCRMCRPLEEGNE
jgi:hypothetical protein